MLRPSERHRLGQHRRADPRSWRTWLSLLIFCAVPTLGIILFLLIGRTRPMGVFQKQADRPSPQS